jgi:hypothetical protein
MRALLIALLLLPAASGCGKKKAELGPVVSAAETAAMEADLMKRVEANRTKQCPRPVLRGQALPGNADADVLALVDAAGPLASCHKAAKAGNDAASEALRSCADKNDSKSCRPRALDDPAAVVPAVADIEAECGDALAAAITRAVSHEDSCSPYLAGRHPLGADATMVQVARAGLIRARQLARDGRDSEAVRLLFDLVRLGQDLARGGGPMIAAMVGVALVSVANQGLEVVLPRGKLAPAEIAALADEAEMLAASQPSFGEVFAGERDAMELYVILPGAKPADWSPPGGWALRDGKPDRPATDPETAAQVGLMMAAVKRGFEEAGKQCKPGDALSVCKAGLSEAERRLNTEAKPAVGDLLKSAGKVMRVELEQKLSAVMLPSFSGFVGKMAEVPLRIAAVRLQLELLRWGAAPCPNAAAMAVGPFPAVMQPPGLGEPLVATDVRGGVELQLPKWASRTVPSRVSCPPVAVPPPRTDK